MISLCKKLYDVLLVAVIKPPVTDCGSLFVALQEVNWK